MLRTLSRNIVRHARAFSSSSIERVAVVGGGQMGTGIAYVAALNAKLNVTVFDVSEKQLAGCQKYFASQLEKDLSKGKITAADVEAAKSRLTVCQNLAEIEKRPVDMVIEAATENIALKCKIFDELSRRTPVETLLATNTSSIPITKIAGATNRPDKVIGMHFFSPVPVMKIVELITGDGTSETTLAKTADLAKRMGKITTRSKDKPGFIANRILMPYINEAVRVLEEGTATREDIDTTMKLGTNVPMGPLTLADFIGLDTCLSIIQVLHQGFNDDKYKPAPLLEKMVAAGHLGRKTKKGFYDY